MAELPGENEMDTSIPPDYQHLLQQADYDKMLGHVLNYFKDKGDKVVSLKDGVVTVLDEDNQDLKYGLDNLVRMIASAPTEDWESVVYTLFNKVHNSENAYQFYFNDYEYARPYIKVQIKPDAILEYEFAKGLVLKKHFPGTVTVLVFDYEGQFRYLGYNDIKNWQKTDEELFEVALDNVAVEEVEVHKMEAENGLEIFTFFSGDFSAVKMIELERNAEYACGTFGAIVTIPSKGATFVSPVINTLVMLQVELLAPLVTRFFEQNPGHITPDIYWYYQGKIEEFIREPAANGFTTIAMPVHLVQLLASKQ